ncbi:MAG: class I SAM-dependent methyltransferase, partial [Salinibacterium sp.]|nr:class I SAM-dependent methyltransferase [Salinibacterium sp.]
AASAAGLVTSNPDPRVAHFRPIQLENGAFVGSSLVLVRLPRSLEALEEIAAVIAAGAPPDVIVLAGGRLKHMSLSMNEVLRRHFGLVTATRARQKSRVLVAEHPIAGAVLEPRRRYYADLELWVVATGGVFAGASIDIGTRAMLEVLDQAPTVRRAIDFGCGTGVLATALARLQPGVEIVASDVSASAVASARLTAEANGVRIETKRDDALSLEPDASADLIVLNPPFHSGGAVHSGAVTRMFEAAARVLRPGGELWTVWNSPLAYKPVLRKSVGQTREVSRTVKFTVTVSTRRR